jgi:glycosyltransferase involved in cell wall biosynthesis
MLISILATCYNNEARLAEFADRVRATLEPLGHPYEIVIIDDGSTDQSWEILRSIALQNPRFRGILLSRNFGQHPAILAGLDTVQGDITVLMDSDLDDEPELIPVLLEPIIQGRAEIVLTQTPEGARRRLSSKLFHWLVQNATESPQTAMIGTYRAFNSRVSKSLREYRDHSSLFGPLSTQIGFRKQLVVLPIKSSAERTSTYNFGKRLRLAWPVLLHEVGLPMKTVILTVALMLVTAIMLGATALVRFLIGGGNPGSTTSLVFLVLIINQALLGVGIAAIALYVRGILRETLRRPRFHIAQDTRDI